MAGINRALVENRYVAKTSASSGSPCIFLSHISVDKPAVQEIATYITSRGGIDIYLDANDDGLQRAASSGDAVAITEFIERGLSNSKVAGAWPATRKFREITIDLRRMNDFGVGTYIGKAISRIDRIVSEIYPFEQLYFGATR